MDPLLSSAFLAMLSTVTDRNPFSKNNFRAAFRMAFFRFSLSRFLLSPSPKLQSFRENDSFCALSQRRIQNVSAKTTNRRNRSAKDSEVGDEPDAVPGRGLSSPCVNDGQATNDQLMNHGQDMTAGQWFLHYSIIYLLSRKIV